MKNVRTMTGVDFARFCILGEQVPPDGLTITGDVVIEGFGENQKLFLDGLDLKKVIIGGKVRVCNAVFSSDLDLGQCQINGSLVIENVIVEGNLTMPVNSPGFIFSLRNIECHGSIQFSAS
jgi:hypothetical protein